MKPVGRVRCTMRTKIKLGNSSSQIQIALGNKSPSKLFCNGTVLIPVNYLGGPPGGHALARCRRHYVSRV